MKFYSFAVLLICAAVCQGDVIYNVSLDTTSLVGNANAPFALDFQLTSGDTTSGVVNTATLSQFSFGTGGSAGTSSPFPNNGNASGDLGTTIGLNTSGGSFFNEFSEYFTPGNMLSFQFDLTNNVQPGGTPDEFTLQLIDNTAGEISTTDPSGSDSLLVIDLTGSSLRPSIYTTDGDGISITPQLASPSSPVPEPAAAGLLSIAAILWTLSSVSRQRRRAAADGI